ncbi:helix-turn-helix domain-containing protein, partial [Staphylococcus aureus]|uniref:LexA family protein n=1 Tax=Staphylococcus aureus TaxID=1280 RepID=UPI002108AA34
MKGYPPSVREIGEAVGLASSSTVHGHLSRLEEKGYIRRDPTKPRAIEIVSDQTVKEEQPDLLVVYSIQTIYHPEISSAPGSVSQVRESTQSLMN